MTNRTNTRPRGFTLIEVLLVIGILAVLATVSVVAYSGIKASSDKKAAALLVKSVENAVKLYYHEMNLYPDDQTGLKALIEPPADEKPAETWKAHGVFLEDGKVPTDPWGHEILYKKNEEGSAKPFRVYSAGPDGTPDNEDDIPPAETK